MNPGLAGLLPDFIRPFAAYTVYKFLFPSEKELLHLREFRRNADGIAIDAGMNLGVYTIELSRLYRAVESFEPVPGYCTAMEKYARTFRAPNIHVHNVALYDQPGELVLHTPVVRGRPRYSRSTLGPLPEGQNAVRTVVPTATLDSFDFRGVDFLKVDVEGAELEVLDGAEETLSRERPTLLIEISPRFTSRRKDALNVRDVHAMIEGKGYRGYFLEHNQIKPLSEFSFERHQKPYLDDIKNPGYVYNFFFVAV